MLYLLHHLLLFVLFKEWIGVVLEALLVATAYFDVYKDFYPKIYPV